MNAISQVFWEDTLENGTVSHVAGQAGSPWSVLISLNAHRMNSLTASQTALHATWDYFVELFLLERKLCRISIYFKRINIQSIEQHALSKKTARLFFDFRTDLKNKTRLCIGETAVQTGNEAQTRPWQADKEHLWGREASVSPRRSSAPTETHTFPERNGLF